MPETVTSVTNVNTLENMPENMLCRCGSESTSCIRTKRWLGIVVIEDILFQEAGLRARKDCESYFDWEQKK